MFLVLKKLAVTWSPLKEKVNTNRYSEFRDEKIIVTQTIIHFLLGTRSPKILRRVNF